MKFFGLILFLHLFCVALLSQKIPTVYQVGEHQEHYNKLVATYETQLLTVCENDMESAFDKWTDLMIDLEVYAKQEGVDIRGVKLWINVFFNEKGRIDYIAYHPKPISLNMDYNKLTKILMKFISFKGIDIKYNSGFSHYGSAHFPVLYQLYHQNEK